MDKIINNKEANRFELNSDGLISIITYKLSEGKINYLHTEVPRELEGGGIASSMAKHVLDYARSEGLSVIPSCRFISSYIKRHPEYEDLVSNE